MIFVIVSVVSFQVMHSEELSIWEKVTGFRKEKESKPKTAESNPVDSNAKSRAVHNLINPHTRYLPLKIPALEFMKATLQQIKVAKVVYPNYNLTIPNYLRQMDGVFWVASREAFAQKSRGREVICVPIYPILTSPLSVEDQKRRPSCITDTPSRMTRFNELDTVVVNVVEIRTPLIKSEQGLYNEVDLENRESVTEVEILGISNRDGLIYKRVHRVKCLAKCTALTYIMGHGHVLNSVEKNPE